MESFTLLIYHPFKEESLPHKKGKNGKYEQNERYKKIVVLNSKSISLADLQIIRMTESHVNQ